MLHGNWGLLPLRLWNNCRRRLELGLHWRHVLLHRNDGNHRSLVDRAKDNTRAKEAPDDPGDRPAVRLLRSDDDSRLDGLVAHDFPRDDFRAISIKTASNPERQQERERATLTQCGELRLCGGCVGSGCRGGTEAATNNRLNKGYGFLGKSRMRAEGRQCGMPYLTPQGEGWYTPGRYEGWNIRWPECSPVVRGSKPPLQGFYFIYRAPPGKVFPCGSFLLKNKVASPGSSSGGLCVVRWEATWGDGCWTLGVHAQNSEQWTLVFNFNKC